MPCPGGSGACAGWAELESSESLSLLGAGGVLGVLLLTTGAAGGVAETLEILMGSKSCGDDARLWRGGNQQAMNPIVKKRVIGPLGPRMVNGKLRFSPPRYWSVLRETAIEASVLVRTQRMSRRR